MWVAADDSPMADAFAQLNQNRVVAIPREIGRLRALTFLYVSQILRLANVDRFASSAGTNSLPCRVRSAICALSSGST